MTFIAGSLRSSLESAANGADIWLAAARMAKRRASEDAPDPALHETPDRDR